MINSCGNAHCHVLIMFAYNFDRNLVAENKRVYYAGFIRVTGPVRKMRYDAGRYGTGLALRVTRVYGSRNFLQLRTYIALFIVTFLAFWLPVFSDIVKCFS